jgi:molybdenum cofactor cytidylyltransferase
MTANNAAKIGGLLLAAGGSSRFGQPKQLVEFEGKTLIRRAAEALADSVCDPVVVVLGAEIEGCTEELAGLGLDICINYAWAEGMSSSLKAGLGMLQRIESELDAVVITLCDQPHVNTSLIDRLTEKFRAMRVPVVAAEYAGTAGVPALFSRDKFGGLMNLKGDKGAREIIRGESRRAKVAFDAAAIDVDRRADLDKL